MMPSDADDAGTAACAEDYNGLSRVVEDVFRRAIDARRVVFPPSHDVMGSVGCAGAYTGGGDAGVRAFTDTDF